MTEPTLVTASTSVLLDLDEIRAHLNLAETDHDALLLRQVERAMRAIEAWTGQALRSETYDQWFDAAEVTGDKLRLGREPVTAITSVTGYADDGTTAAMTSADYYVTTWGLALKSSGAGWPVGTGLRKYEAVKVRFTAGHTSTTLPTSHPLREAVLKMTAYLFSLRGDGAQDGQPSEIPDDVHALLGPYLHPGVA